jgi:hypothetical protein
VQQCQQGTSQPDLAAVKKVRSGESGQMIVTVPMLEDPAEASFTVLQEAKGWRIVFLKGTPDFPYANNH